MPKQKEQIKLMSLSEIVDYAIRTYPCIELHTHYPDGVIKKETVRNYILRKLIQHHLYPGSNKENLENASDKKENDSKNTNDDKKVSEIIAKFIVDEFAYPHFKKNIEQSTEKTEKRFESMDEQRQYENLMAFLDYQEEIIRTNGSVCDVKYENNHSDDGKYHIPKVCFDEYSQEFEDRTVKEIMLNFFNECYDFHEEEFRKDLEERSGLIDVNNPFLTGFGYEELTWKLEHPVGNYIFPKENVKGSVKN